MTLGSPVTDMFQALYSHAMRPSLSVHAIFTEGLRGTLRPRLTAVAAMEFSTLMTILSDIHLTNAPVKRQCPFAANGDRFRTAPLYKILAGTGEQPGFVKYVWNQWSPPVLHAAAIPKSNSLQNKPPQQRHPRQFNLLYASTCAQADETAQYLLFDCAFANSFWTSLGMNPAIAPPVTQLWEIARHPHIPAERFDVFIHLCCWNLWKHRHDVVFRELHPSLQRLRQACKCDAMLWKYRRKPEDAHVAESWCNLFSSPM